jgi:hypothetical protein
VFAYDTELREARFRKIRLTYCQSGICKELLEAVRTKNIAFLSAAWSKMAEWPRDMPTQAVQQTLTKQSFWEGIIMLGVEVTKKAADMIKEFLKSQETVSAVRIITQIG